MRLGNLCPSLSLCLLSLKAGIRYSFSLGLLISSQAMISCFLFLSFKLLVCFFCNYFSSVVHFCFFLKI